MALIIGLPSGHDLLRKNCSKQSRGAVLLKRMGRNVLIFDQVLHIFNPGNVLQQRRSLMRNDGLRTSDVETQHFLDFEQRGAQRIDL